LLSLLTISAHGIPMQGQAHSHDELHCGSPDTSEEALNAIDGVMARFAANICPKVKSSDVPMCGNNKQGTATMSTIPTVVHILHTSTGEGNISLARVEENIAIMNNDFAGRGMYTNTNFRFNLINVNRVQNDLWASNMIVMEQVFKPALSVSPIDTLNIYVGIMQGGVVGMCYFPYMHFPDDPMHGCLVHHEGWVGGNLAPYNEGQCAVHEVGHGLGLQHCWQGSCNFNGDHVNDTSPQETNSRGCPDPVPESCEPGFPDNIHNHMDYSDDSCRYEFTPGQSDRMDHVVATFHPGYLHETIRDAIAKADPHAWDEAKAFAGAYKEQHHLGNN